MLQSAVFVAILARPPKVASRFDRVQDVASRAVQRLGLGQIGSEVFIVSASRSPPGLCSDNVVAVFSYNEAAAGIAFYEFDIHFGITFSDLG